MDKLNALEELVNKNMFADAIAVLQDEESKAALLSLIKDEILIGDDEELYFDLQGIYDTAMDNIRGENQDASNFAMLLKSIIIESGDSIPDADRVPFSYNMDKGNIGKKIITFTEESPIFTEYQERYSMRMTKEYYRLLTIGEYGEAIKLIRGEGSGQAVLARLNHEFNHQQDDDYNVKAMGDIYSLENWKLLLDKVSNDNQKDGNQEAAWLLREVIKRVTNSDPSNNMKEGGRRRHEMAGPATSALGMQGPGLAARRKSRRRARKTTRRVRKSTRRAGKKYARK